MHYLFIVIMNWTRPKCLYLFRGLFRHIKTKNSLIEITTIYKIECFQHINFLITIKCICMVITLNYIQLIGPKTVLLIIIKYLAITHCNNNLHRIPKTPPKTLLVVHQWFKKRTIGILTKLKLLIIPYNGLYILVLFYTEKLLTYLGPMMDWIY